MSSGPTLAEPSARRRFRLLHAIPLLVFAGLVVLFGVRLFSGDPSRLPSALLGRPVPSFSLPPLADLRGPGGAPVPALAASDLRGGGVTVLNVWASWCAPCRTEHPLLLELARDPSLRLVGMAYKDKPADSRRFLGLLGNPFAAVGVDVDGRTAIEFGVYGVPETFIVGPDGTIRHRHVGPLTPEALPDFLSRVKAAARN